MDPLAIASVALFFSCLAGFALGRRHATVSDDRRMDWLCVRCGQRNEFDLDRCWSCGLETATIAAR